MKYRHTLQHTITNTTLLTHPLTDYTLKMEHFTSYTDFTLFPEQQQSFTDVEAMTAHSIEGQRAVHQAWEEIRVARQAVIDRPILEAEFPPLFDDAEQSGKVYDNGEGEYPQYPWFRCNPMEQEEEDCNPIKEKYMQGFPMYTFNLLLTSPLSPEPLAKTTTPSPTPTKSPNHKHRGGAPLTPSQIDDLLIFWGTPELVVQHHHSRLIPDLEGEDRIPAMPSFLDEDKLAYILDWRDGPPIR